MHAQTRRIRLEGTELFRNILHNARFQPLESLDKLAEVEPSETLVVVFGENKVLDKIRPRLRLGNRRRMQGNGLGLIGGLLGRLRSFVEDGGGLLIASDRRLTLLSDWDLRISGKPVIEDEGTAYRGLQFCPSLTVKPTQTLFDGVFRIATNHPSSVEFRHLPNGFGVLASFSKNAWQEGKVQSPLHFMVGTTDEKRALILAGHGVFMNMMLAQDDNDNISFALNCARWLSQAPDGGKRKYALFVENGAIVTEFDLGLSGPPRLPVPPTEVMNRMLQGLQEEDFFNRLLLNEHVLGRERILRGFLILFSALLCLYAGWRFLRARQRLETSVPLLDQGITPADTLSPLAQRRQALVQQDDFGEAARALARGFFEEFTTVQPIPGRTAPEPVIRTSAIWWRSRALTRHIRYLWGLAYGAARRVSGRELSRLPRKLDNLADALRNGSLILEAKE